ncbi:MAG: glycosyltransferase family 2 protein [Lentisphaeria bacterium]|nr:glycosyltransferase family 2 protein [Lentisphaeria bacterium]
MKLSVLIPAYNEEKTIDHIIACVKDCGVKDLEIVIVNDCSSDGTGKALEKYASDPRIRILHHEVNKGKGAAIRTGLASTTGDAVVIQDADLEYDPAELPRLFRYFEEGKADVVYGSRYSGNAGQVDRYWHYAVNAFLTKLSNMLSNLRLTDMETCYKMIRGDVFRSLKLTSNRFGIEPEVTARLADMDLRIFEIPISYKPRSGKEGKKIGWKDGVMAMWYIVKFNLFS